jgi:hypothetical protein
MASPHVGIYAIRARAGFSAPPGVSQGNGSQFYHAKKPESSDQREFGGYLYYYYSGPSKCIQPNIEEKGRVF